MLSRLSSFSGPLSKFFGAAGSTTPPITEATTILEYNTSQGYSFEWDGITFTLNNTLSNYSYTATITTIPSSGVPNSNELMDLTIGNSVTSIGNNAFEFCTQLTSITIPDSVTSIGDNVFKDCFQLTSITIPNSVTSIGELSFAGCGALTSITIPDSVTSISLGLFYDCTSLVSITLPTNASFTSIGVDAFAGCTSLETITIPNSVTSIGNGSFQDCALTSITIPNSVTSIGDYAFKNCISITSITIPDLVTSIGNGTFQGCISLETITLPDLVTSIGEVAFAGCTLLTSIILTDSITSIGNNAFQGCSTLATITIPDSIESIGVAAFYDCTSLETITLPTNPLFIIISTALFFGCTSLETITIPDSVTTISNAAFMGCALTSITIPFSVISIGPSAFKNCTALESIRIPNTVLYIYSEAFKDSGLLTVTIDDTHLGITSPSSGVSFFGATVTTITGLPTVTSDSYGSLFNGSATVTGTITSDGGSAILERGIVWSTSPNPTIFDNKVAGTGTAVETFTQTYLIPNPYAYIYVRTYATNAYGTGYGTDLYFILPCFVKGTKITMFDGTKKNIEDISYEDNLLVWNFDDGQFDSAKPLWIMEMVKTPSVNILFSDGSKLGISGYLQHDGGHRIFNLDKGEFTYAIPNEHTPIGTRTFNDKGEQVTIVGKEEGEFSEIYNVVTNRHLNIFAEGVLTSRRLNNIYPISDMKFVKEERNITPIEEFNHHFFYGKGITEEYYNGLRLGEQPLVKVSEGFLTKSPGELAYVLPTIEELAEWTLGFIQKKYEPVYEDIIS